MLSTLTTASAPCPSLLYSSTAKLKYLPSVNENPLDCVAKSIRPEEVDAARDSRIRYLADLEVYQAPYSEDDQVTLNEIATVQSRALCANRFTVASCSGIVFSGVLAAVSCAGAYLAAVSFDLSTGWGMLFAGSANALGNLIMYRDSRNQSRAADLKQDLHRKLCEEYVVLSKRLLEHYYLNFKSGEVVSNEWVEVARRIKQKSQDILGRFEGIFPEKHLEASDIIAPLYDAAHHIATGSKLFRSDLRDFIHTWNRESSFVAVGGGTRAAGHELDAAPSAVPQIVIDVVATSITSSTSSGDGTQTS